MLSFDFVMYVYQILVMVSQEFLLSSAYFQVHTYVHNWFAEKGPDSF